MSPEASDGGERDDTDVAEDAEALDAEGEGVEVADDDEPSDSDDEQEAGDDEAPAADATSTRARSTTRAAGTKKAAPALTDKQKADAIRMVDPTERRIGFIGAALTVVIGLVAFVPYISNPKKRVSDEFTRVGKHCPKHFTGSLVKGVHECNGWITFPRSHWIVELLIVCLFAIFIGVATWYGRRSLVAFALLFGGLAVVSTTGSIVGLAYVAAGGWLLVRAYRVQKYGTTSGKEVAAIVAEQRAERKAGVASGTTRKASARPGSTKGTTTTKTKKAPAGDGKSRPEANRRYTPKTPPRKRPVPPST